MIEKTEKPENLYHVIWKKFEEIVDIEVLSEVEITGKVVHSIKAREGSGDRNGATWNLGKYKIKEMTITKINRKENPEYFL